MFQPTNVAPAEQIFTYCVEMQAVLETHYTADNIEAVIDRSNLLEGYMALSGKLLADAKYQYNASLNSVFIEAVKEGNKEKMQTSTLNKYIDSICRDYQYLVDWTDRINRACTHQLEFSRSLISKLKEEFKAAQWTGQPR